MFGPLAAPPRPPHEVLEDGATEAEAAETTGSCQAASRRRCRASCAGVVCAASALLAALAALAGSSRVAEPALGTAFASKAASLLPSAGARGIAGVVRSEGVGCGNWHSASLEIANAGDAGSCVDGCRQTAGCVAVNYQATKCPEKPEEQDGQGACYLLNEECIEGPNECWDAYTLPESERKVMGVGSRVSRSTGCSNLDQISKGGETTVWSVYTCSLKCEQDADCVGIVYEAEPCGNQEKGRRCVLLNGECSEDDSESFACWDLSYKSATGTSPPASGISVAKSKAASGALWTSAVSISASRARAALSNAASMATAPASPSAVQPTVASGSMPAFGGNPESDSAFAGGNANAKKLKGLFKLTEDALAGDKEITVDLPDCFLVGDTIKLSDWKNNFHENHRIVSMDPILLSPPVEHPFNAGASVLRIHHPDPASTCGAWPSGAPQQEAGFR